MCSGNQSRASEDVGEQRCQGHGAPGGHTLTSLEPGGLQSMGSQRVRQDLMTEQQQKKGHLRPTFLEVLLCIPVMIYRL